MYPNQEYVPSLEHAEAIYGVKMHSSKSVRQVQNWRCEQRKARQARQLRIHQGEITHESYALSQRDRTMVLNLRDRALLVKLYYQKGENGTAALREYRRQRQLRRGPMSLPALKKMMKKFEATGLLRVQPGRGRKPVAPEQREDVATAVVEQSLNSAVQSASARGVSRELGMPLTTVWKIMRKVLRLYPYKITMVQELRANDPQARVTFALTFLARMEVEQDFPFNVLWSDEAHFHLHGTVNAHNCRIWGTDHPHAFHEVPLHSPKVTVWCGFTARFILGPYFFEQDGPRGPVTCTVTAARYANMLTNYVIPKLQQRQCLQSTVFMHDGAPPHIGRDVTRVLREHFTEGRVFARAFPTTWPSRSPDLNPCDFWLWGYLKSTVYEGHVPDLPTLKERISLHVNNITVQHLRSTVEHAIHRLHAVEDRNGAHIENFELHR